jgi:CubicO group peptidase (beta-lactamase class C family)
MADEGKLAIDAPVTKYLPGFVPRYGEPGARAITLRDLATHSAGLTNYWGAGGNSPTEEELIGWMRQSGLAVQPGYQKKYSNYGFAVLGQALAHAADKPYETLLRERVLEPLHMTESGLEELYDAPDLARGYVERDGRLVAQPRSRPFRAQAPASALVSHVEDIARFGIAHLSRDPQSVVPPRIQDLLFTLHASGTGLGWHYATGGGVPRWWHLGAWNMNYTRIVVRPDVGVGLVLATNGPWGYDPLVSFVKLLAPHADTSDLDALCGDYADAEGEVVVHRPPGPEMTLEVKETGRLIPISRHTFRVSGNRKADGTWVRFLEEDGENLMLWERRHLTKKAP